MKPTILIIFLILFIVILIWYFLKGDSNSVHLQKPLKTTEKAISDDLIQNLINSDYAKKLDSLKVHIEGHKVINSTVGNAGFILYLENNIWASAYRVDNSILSDFGNGEIPEKSMDNINSTKFGDASISILDDKPYANEPNDIKTEVKKSHSKIIEGLAIGDNTFNFAFADGMELDFQLCNDKEGKPAIRVFWEQW
jgi:hypothetical protein